MDIRYAAGFFDGEGCVRIDRLIIPKSPSRPSGYMRYQLKVSVAQANPLPLVMLREVFGGSIASDTYATKKREASRTRNQWIAWSRFAYDFLIAVRPHLLVKADEADLAISLFEEMDANRTWFRQHRGNPPNKPEILARRDAIYEQLAALKRQSYSPVNSGPMSVSAV